MSLSQQKTKNKDVLFSPRPAYNSNWSYKGHCPACRFTSRGALNPFPVSTTATLYVHDLGLAKSLLIISHLSCHVPATLSCCCSSNTISTFPTFSQALCTCCSPRRSSHRCLMVPSLILFSFLCKCYFLGKSFAEHSKTTISHPSPLSWHDFSP